MLDVSNKIFHKTLPLSISRKSNIQDNFYIVYDEYAFRLYEDFGSKSVGIYHIENCCYELQLEVDFEDSAKFKHIFGLLENL